jgi:hypothetical protein
MDVTGTVAARIMEIGRWRGDASLISFGSDLFNRIDATRVSNQVPHDLIVSVRSPATLIDYLAYSDAALQDYLSSGRVVSLQNGLAVLQRALSTFAGPNPGEYRIGLPPGSDLLPDTTIAPQLVDDVGESASAKIVRLCTSYGWLLLGTPSETNPGVLLLRSAFATESLMAEPASGLGIFTAAFSCSSALLADNTYGITVGQDAQALADGLASARPYRFIAPAFGPVRPDLRDKPAGIYVVRDGVPSGPLSIEQALNALPRKLNVGN